MRVSPMYSSKITKEVVRVQQISNFEITKLKKKKLYDNITN